MAQRDEFAVIRGNDDRPIGYARSERTALESADTVNQDEAEYQGCAVADLAFPAYVKQLVWAEDEGD